MGAGEKLRAASNQPTKLQAKCRSCSNTGTERFGGDFCSCQAGKKLRAESNRPIKLQAKCRSCGNTGTIPEFLGGGICSCKAGGKLRAEPNLETRSLNSWEHAIGSLVKEGKAQERNGKRRRKQRLTENIKELTQYIESSDLKWLANNHGNVMWTCPVSVPGLKFGKNYSAQFLIRKVNDEINLLKE